MFKVVEVLVDQCVGKGEEGLIDLWTSSHSGASYLVLIWAVGCEGVFSL